MGVRPKATPALSDNKQRQQGVPDAKPQSVQERECEERLPSKQCSAIHPVLPLEWEKSQIELCRMSTGATKTGNPYKRIGDREIGVTMGA